MNEMAEKKYSFYVNPDATKSQIKEAVEKMFSGTEVEYVNTMNLQGKNRRRGTVIGKTAAKKKTNNVYVEFAGNKFNVEKIEKAVKADYTKKSGKKTMTTVNIYVKPEDGKAYYVIDRKKGDVAL